MARSYANIITAIWQDADWRALNASPQRTYLMLVTQANISAAGTMPLTVRRWAAGAGDTSSDDIRADLAVLAAGRYVVVDEDTEELLVRSFVRHDKGYANEKRRRAITDAAGHVESAVIRQALSAEFVRVGLPPIDAGGPPEPTPENRDRASDAASDRASAESDSTGERPEPAEPAIVVVDIASPQVDRASDTPSDATYQNRRVVVTEVELVVPHSSLHNPQSALRPERDAPDRNLAFIATALGATDEEANSVLDEVRKTHRPRKLGGYLRTMHANGDLAAILDDHRRRRARTDAGHANRARLDAIDRATQAPPPGTATPEEAAAARQYLRDLLSGRVPRGGEPAAAFRPMAGRSA